MIEKIQKESSVQNLILDRRQFYRVKRGQTAREVEKTLAHPANDCFSGAVIAKESCNPYTVQPFETYSSIAAKYSLDGEELKKFNGDRPLYPSCRIFIPD